MVHANICWHGRCLRAWQSSDCWEGMVTLWCRPREHEQQGSSADIKGALCACAGPWLLWRSPGALVAAKAPIWKFLARAWLVQWPCLTGVLHGVQAYQKAIDAAVAKLREEEGEVHALELGCGTGLLSVMAAKAGVTSVVACDMHDALCVATRKARASPPRPVLCASLPLLDKAFLAAKAGAASVVACDMHDALCVATRKASALLPRPLMHLFLCLPRLFGMFSPKPTTHVTASCNVASLQSQLSRQPSGGLGSCPE